jgi:hypothetical protein
VPEVAFPTNSEVSFVLTVVVEPVVITVVVEPVVIKVVVEPLKLCSFAGEGCFDWLGSLVTSLHSGREWKRGEEGGRGWREWKRVKRVRRVRPPVLAILILRAGGTFDW